MRSVDVEAEYARLGYNEGWAFIMTPEERLHTAKVVLVCLNPGAGGDGDEGRWDCPEGNVFFRRKWAKGGVAYTSFQRQVHRIHEVLELGEEDVFVAQFVPFRSSAIKSLALRDEAFAFARRLWGWVIEVSPATLFICMGKDTSWEVSKLLGAGSEETVRVGWGAQTIGRQVAPSGRIVVRIPHPSHFPIFSGTAQEFARAQDALRYAARPADASSI